MYPRALASGENNGRSSKVLDGVEICESSDVGVQVETLEHKRDAKDETNSSEKPICDKAETSGDEK